MLLLLFSGAGRVKVAAGGGPPMRIFMGREIIQVEEDDWLLAYYMTRRMMVVRYLGEKDED